MRGNFGSAAWLNDAADLAGAVRWGTLSALMNNGKEAGMGGGEKHSIGDRRRRREGGSDVHLTGGGVPLLDLSRFAALTAVRLTPPPFLVSHIFPLFFAHSISLFYFLQYSISPSNTLLFDHMI